MDCQDPQWVSTKNEHSLHIVTYLHNKYTKQHQVEHALKNTENDPMRAEGDNQNPNNELEDDNKFCRSLNNRH
ncbi:hypothetical protein EYF80_020831 [Liparis tanakae]|uniref:Uncharacterized protein n=1 Tax=Liparis tanakae TaxID=230148 RepID=A0A4Z2HTI9_9TELE|nr:hypothetical protein EYF80_020831 [Liparis tanakae]